MTVWFCDINGVESGPFSPSQLIQKIHEGTINKDTPVRKDDSQWVRAIEVNGLFEAAARPIKRKVCPYCSRVNPGNPPCVCPGCEREIQRVIQKSEPSPVTANGERNPDAPSKPSSNGIKRWVKKLFD
ncbi:MAG: DUF4339 domain-containing protein [Planctomycetales bacterium]|nr:DUF4339 domain-containing protein [Planctomycetales bacterium]